MARLDGAVAFPRAHRRLLLHARGQVRALDSAHSRDRVPHPRPPARIGRGHARSRRVNGRARRDQRDSRHGGELFRAGSHHDRTRRHRAAHRAQWRNRRAQPGRDCQPMVSLVGRDHDGGRLVDRPRGKAGDFHQPVQKPSRQKEEQRQRHSGGHRAAALDFLRRRADPQPARNLAHPSLLRRADRSRAPLAAAGLCSHRHLRQLDGAHLLDADQFPQQDHAVLHRRDRSHQSRVESHHRGNDGGSRLERREPALRHQARLHARRQAAPAGHRALHRNYFGRPGRDAAFLPPLPPAGRRWHAQPGDDCFRPISHASASCNGRAWPI